MSLASYPTGNLCNADQRVRPLPPTIRPLTGGTRIAGPARTARVAPGENGGIHRAVHHSCPGEVLVVAGGASDRRGHFGDLLADACMAKGMVGAVLDCTIRDRADIAALGFPVYARGLHPEATSKAAPGEINLVVDIGGTRIAPGDWIVADEDGAVVVPADAVDDVLAAVVHVAAREEGIRSRIRRGETTCEIFNIDPGLPEETPS